MQKLPDWAFPLLCVALFLALLLGAEIRRAANSTPEAQVKAYNTCKAAGMDARIATIDGDIQCVPPQKASE